MVRISGPRGGKNVSHLLYRGYYTGEARTTQYHKDMAEKVQSLRPHWTQRPSQVYDQPNTLEQR